MSCAHCHRELKLSRILGYRHADDRRYWCNDDHLFHGSPDISANILFCQSIRDRFGF